MNQFDSPKNRYKVIGISKIDNTEWVINPSCTMKRAESIGRSIASKLQHVSIYNMDDVLIREFTDKKN